MRARATHAGARLFLVTPGLAAICVGFALFLGTVAGIIPAFRAARLDPVTALHAN